MGGDEVQKARSATLVTKVGHTGRCPLDRRDSYLETLRKSAAQDH